MENKVYVVYTDDGKRVGFMIVSDGKTSMYINEGNPKQATIDAIADYRDVLKNTETYDRIFLSDALKQQQEEAKQKRELEEKIAEAKKATEENKEKSVTDNRTEEDKLDERAAKYGIANLKPSNTLKKWVATGAIALIVGFGLGNIKNIKNFFVNNYNNAKNSISTSIENIKEQNQAHEIFTKQGIDTANELTAAAMNVDGKYQTFTATEWLTSYYEQNAGMFTDAKFAQMFNGYEDILKNREINHMSLSQKRINYFGLTENKNAIDPFLNLFENDHDKEAIQKLWNLYFTAKTDSTDENKANFNNAIKDIYGFNTNKSGFTESYNNEHFGAAYFAADIISAGGMNGIVDEETMNLIYGNNNDIKGAYSTTCSLMDTKTDQTVINLAELKGGNGKLESLENNIKTPRQMTEEDYVKLFNNKINTEIAELEKQEQTSYNYGNSYTEGYSQQVAGSSLGDEERKAAEEEAKRKAIDETEKAIANAQQIAKAAGIQDLTNEWNKNFNSYILGTMSIDTDANALINAYSGNYKDFYISGVNEAKGVINTKIAEKRAEIEASKPKDNTNTEIQETQQEQNNINNVSTQETVTVTEEKYDNNGNLVSSSVVSDSSIPGTQAYDAAVYGLDIPGDYYESQSSGVSR